MGQIQTKMKSKSKIKRKFDFREDYFIRNGGILLEKQIALSQGRDVGAGQLKVFSYNDIERLPTTLTRISFWVLATLELCIKQPLKIIL